MFQTTNQIFIGVYLVGAWAFWKIGFRQLGWWQQPNFFGTIKHGNQLHCIYYTLLSPGSFPAPAPASVPGKRCMAEGRGVRFGGCHSTCCPSSSPFSTAWRSGVVHIVWCLYDFGMFFSLKHGFYMFFLNMFVQFYRFCTVLHVFMVVEGNCGTWTWKLLKNWGNQLGWCWG